MPIAIELTAIAVTRTRPPPVNPRSVSRYLKNQKVIILIGNMAKNPAHKGQSMSSF